MKTLFLIFAFGSVCLHAKAAEFKTTPVYCNGPVTDGNVSSCPAFSTWMGVTLKNLKIVNLPVGSTDTSIRLEDEAGQSWKQELETCKSKLTNLRGCNAKVESTAPGHIAIHISVWSIGHNSQNLGLFIDDGQLSLVPDQSDSLMFTLTSK